MIILYPWEYKKGIFKNVIVNLWFQFSTNNNRFMCTQSRKSQNNNKEMIWLEYCNYQQPHLAFCKRRGRIGHPKDRFAELSTFKCEMNNLTSLYKKWNSLVQKGVQILHLCHSFAAFLNQIYYQHAVCQSVTKVTRMIIMIIHFMSKEDIFSCKLVSI